MRELRIRRLSMTLTGDFDQLAQHEACAIVVLWRFVFGFEAGGLWRRGYDDLECPFVWIYLGAWLLELFLHIPGDAA